MPRRQHHNRPAILRLATHNVCHTLSGFVEGVKEWRQQRYDVVALQEMHASLERMQLLRQSAAQYGFHLCYSIHAASDGAQGGVAMLVSYAVCPVLHDSDIVAHDSGRLLCMQLDWGGHKLWLVNCYIPNDSLQAAAFIRDTLQPHLSPPQGPARRTVMLGDWNFVHDPAVDRIRTGMQAVAAHAATPSDTACTAAFRDAAAHMHDTFRHKHPHRKGVSFFYRRNNTCGAARLDRIYVCSELLQFVASADILTVLEPYSDHRAGVLHLIAADAWFWRGKAGRERVKMWFWDNPDLRAQWLQWTDDMLDSAPHGDAALVAWWRGFKATWAAFTRQLNATRRQQSLPPQQLQARRRAAARELHHAFLALEVAATDAAAVAAGERVLAARREWAAVVAANQRHARSAAPPPEWLHQHERACPAFTAAMRPPRAATCVHAIRHPAGHLIRPGVGQADVMVQHYAAISAAAAVDQAALAAVKASIPQHGPVGLTVEAEAALGSDVVSTAEVRRAVKGSKTGKSPGADGIPTEMYRRAGQQMLDVLARLFTAVGRTGCTPTNFLDGVITSIHKDGDATAPANYRPITLLNTDYRLLAKTLANRCLKHTPHLISPEQSAFLKGRNIGDSIMFLQLLPHQLAVQNVHGAYVAFLDFRKAYDTVNRQFLREVLHSLHVGDGFVKWVMLLLADTKASAVLNGFRSHKVSFGAGVRQGCPLAPLLYLFVGEALLRFMKAQPQLGIEVAGVRRVATQFADDTHPLVRDDAAVHALVDTLRTFEQASNQGLNLSKSILLPVGPPRQLPAPVHGGQHPLVAGIPVKQCAVSMGVAFHCDLQPAQPKLDWARLETMVKSKADKLAKLPLSAFGRAMGATTYVLSKLLFYAEYTGLPSDAAVTRIQTYLARLVDRGGKVRAFTHVRSELLVGAAKEGGFGLLDWRKHVVARHAVLAVKLVVGEASKPWIQLGRALLQHLWRHDRWHVLMPVFAAAQHPDHAQREDSDEDMPACMPAPLHRIFSAFHCLPVPRDILPFQPLDLVGQPCMHFPILGNPWVQDPMQPSAHVVLKRGRPWVMSGLFKLEPVGRVAALIDAVLACDRLRARFGLQFAAQFWKRLAIWGHIPYVVARGVAAQFSVWVGQQWLQAARAATAGGAGDLCATGEHEWDTCVERMVRRLGWTVQTEGLPVDIHLHQLTVRAAYGMLLQPVVQLRQQRWQHMIAEATTGSADQPVSALQVTTQRKLMHDLWRHVKWHNQHKQLYWRFAVGGLVHPDRYGTLVARGCACFCTAAGHQRPGRAHMYWNCHAAQAVLNVMCSCLGADGLQRRHVWLMEMPDEMLPAHFAQLQPRQQTHVRRAVQDVWRVVCLAALGAMGKVANKVVFGMHELAASPRGVAVVAADLATVTFWDLLADYARSSRVPGAWRRVLPHGTPFLHFPTPASRLSINDLLRRH